MQSSPFNQKKTSARTRNIQKHLFQISVRRKGWEYSRTCQSPLKDVEVGLGIFENVPVALLKMWRLGWEYSKKLQSPS